jgi:uracil-DNA glycosylase family 4
MRPSFIENIYHLDGPLHLYLGKTIPVEEFYKHVVIEDNFLRILFLTGHYFCQGAILSAGATELFSKMLKAIGLRRSECELFSITDGIGSFELKSDCLARLKLLIFKYRPKLVITFGADATSVFFKYKERLSKVHGITYDKRLELNNKSFSFNLVPIFHPELLLVNTPMKEIVWQDFQNLMAKNLF